MSTTTDQYTDATVIEQAAAILWLHYGDDDILTEPQKAALDSLAARLTTLAHAEEDEEEIEPGHFAIAVAFDYEETATHHVTARVVVPETIADDVSEVTTFLRVHEDAWFEQFDPDVRDVVDDETHLDNVRILKLVES
ncbi:hypothetical protein ACFOY2_46095 [Nonomuraea purpurea]|uniref:Uncharacterized protein n=1 Tax=Nonomuraea purpurea TaxID=1849276 RepID=A0ABV8GP25_9ACTN